jgi:hypothetical protein
VRRRVSKPARFSPALQRLGLALPPPFVGREVELGQLTEELIETPVAVVLGAVGAGKTRLGLELLARRDQFGASGGAYVRCWSGDRSEAVRARAERALGVAPGSLDAALRDQNRVLVVDDAHHLSGGAGDAFGDLVRRPGNGRLVLLAREAPALPRSAPSQAELSLEGLDAAAARELWAHLEETYGPTPAGACDGALCRTRGLPLALRREYAQAAIGGDAWELDRLAPEAREALEIVAVAAEPIAPAGVATLAGGAMVEAALIELVSRQLIEPLEDGRFQMHDVVRDEALVGLTAERRAALERGAAALVLRGAGDDGAFRSNDPVDRLRAAIRHLCAAGDRAAAIELLGARAGTAIDRAAGGELIGLIGFVGGSAATLSQLRAEIAARRGEVAAALEAGGPEDPVDRAELRFRSGEVGAARAELDRLVAGGDLGARAAALLAEIETERGELAHARELVGAAFDSALGDVARARLHLALALIEERSGQVASARASLSRALGAARSDAALSALVETRRASCLMAEGRLREAEAILDQAERSACDGDAGGVADEVRTMRALVRAARGELGDGCQVLIELVQARRARGDELAALRSEIDLADLYERRGELRAAAELASAAAEAARRLELDALARRGDDIAAAVEVAAWRRASTGERVRGAGRGPISDAAGRGENRAALALARTAASAAERIGNPADLADALAWCARLEMAAGDRAAAELSAGRAAREATASGATWARCAALLVLAAAARENGDLVSASSYARDAAEVASAAGLAVERLVAERALEAIAGPGGRQTLGGAAAGMSEAARDTATRALADLGLISVRPFRLIGQDGQESRVADASPDRLRMAERDLVVDGVRECIVRSGKSVADLRRRSLLKRLLFLFAAQPGRIFSKEEIVQTVWSVEYHPLRHDAALFTNIMRIRRLLGRDGAELIRVSEEGYRFTPGKDFLFVEPA